MGSSQVEIDDFQFSIYPSFFTGNLILKTLLPRKKMFRLIVAVLRMSELVNKLTRKIFSDA